MDDWGKAVNYAGLYHNIYHCKDSMQLYAHCLLLSGQGDKAMEIYNQYMQSNWFIVCLENFLNQNGSR